MQVYTIGYKSTDVAKAIEITHDRLFSKAELEALVCDVLPDAARRHIAALADKERKRGQIPDELFDSCFIPHVTFNHVYMDVVELLIERHGFQRLAYTAEVSVFAIPDLLVRGDAAGDPDGDEDLQNKLSDALANAGLPVVSLEGREAQEEGKLDNLAPIRRERRAQRSVARFKATGHNPLRTEDVELAKVVLSQLAERALEDGELTALGEIWSGLGEELPSLEDLVGWFQARPALQALAALLAAGLPKPPPVVEEPVKPVRAKAPAKPRAVKATPAKTGTAKTGKTAAKPKGQGTAEGQTAVKAAAKPKSARKATSAKAQSSES
jgi:hypothetical protein